MKVHKLILVAVALVAMTITAFAQPEVQLNLGAEGVLFREEGVYSVWIPEDAENDIWTPALTFTAEELEEMNAEDLPAKNMVVMEENGVTVERLTNGQWQILVPPDSAGKIHVTVFDADFIFSHEYDLFAFPIQQSVDEDTGGLDETA